MLATGKCSVVYCNGSGSGSVGCVGCVGSGDIVFMRYVYFVNYTNTHISFSLYICILLTLRHYYRKN